uniref:Uncharacterized protein LOC105127003 n=1 Tax=Rhizophora mucronata TaxID=61149 RepID=A0A2P2KTN1_RHIMU
MAFGFIYYLQELWPFSVMKFDDLRESDKLVRKLSIPENTKRFVYAVRDQESRSVIYILSAQNLSERSAVDAECLIREVRPEAVVTLVGRSTACEIQSEEKELDENCDASVPTSSFEVLRRCFVDKITREKYENLAGNLVLREIFGIGFHGHILAAKRVAKEAGSSFLVLEAPVVKASVGEKSSGEVDGSEGVQGLVTSLVPLKLGGLVSSSLRRFYLTDDVQSQMVKLLSSHVDASMRKSSPPSSVPEAGLKPLSTFQVPSFAQSIYPLFVDLHNIFNDLPSIGRALAFSQNMLYDINRGEVVNARTISEVYTFRVAVEGLRIALNNAGRLPIRRMVKSDETKMEFSALPVEEKSYALLSQALQSQTKKFKNIVAVVDASSLAGLRKHWNTPVPPGLKDLVAQLVVNYESDDEVSHSSGKKWLFSNKPMVALGAGATAVVGASSFSKVVPVSTFIKGLTLKLPASVKLMLLQTQRTMGITLSKALLPSKIVAPGMVNSGANATSALKVAASAEKIQTVVHGIIASVEKTSFSAMRTAFYEIMRTRQARPVSVLPWVTFGCSIATCSGLFVYGDGIECAAESFPAAPSIASLGRGIQSLRETSQVVKQTDASRIQKSIESLMHRLRKIKVQ